MKYKIFQLPLTLAIKITFFRSRIKQSREINLSKKLSSPLPFWSLKCNISSTSKVRHKNSRQRSSIFSLSRALIFPSDRKIRDISWHDPWFCQLTRTCILPRAYIRFSRYVYNILVRSIYHIPNCDISPHGCAILAEPEVLGKERRARIFFYRGWENERENFFSISKFPRGIWRTCA